MNILDILLSVMLIVIGAVGGFSSVVRRSRRGQSRFVSFVLSLLFIVGGILCLVFGVPASEYLG